MAVNAPSPRAQPEDKGRLLPCYQRQHACANYYNTSHLIGPHDVAMNTACLINNIKLSLREQDDMKINALLPIGVNALGG